MDLFGHEDPEEYIVRRRQEMEHPAGFATHEALKEAITSCSRCPLRREGGLGPVLSTGPADAPLMIVGEGPGGVEDDYGGPLIGPSGQLLDKALASVGITRDHVYVTNIVKCRPRGNRTPCRHHRSWQSRTPLLPGPRSRHHPLPRSLDRFPWHSRHADLPSRLPSPPERPRTGRCEMAGLLRPQSRQGTRRHPPS